DFHSRCGDQRGSRRSRRGARRKRCGHGIRAEPLHRRRRDDGARRMAGQHEQAPHRTWTSLARAPLPATGRRPTGVRLVDVQLAQQRKRVVERLKQILVALDHLAAHVDAKPLLVEISLSPNGVVEPNREDRLDRRPENEIPRETPTVPTLDPLAEAARDAHLARFEPADSDELYAPEADLGESVVAATEAAEPPAGSEPAHEEPFDWDRLGDSLAA